MINLDPLPASDNEYWKEAEVNKIQLQPPVKCEHFFVRTTGTEVKCSKCPIGFIVTPDLELTKGHLHKHGSLMI